MGKERAQAKLERSAMVGDVREGRRGKWQGKNLEGTDSVFTVPRKRITAVRAKSRGHVSSMEGNRRRPRRPLRTQNKEAIIILRKFRHARSNRNRSSVSWWSKP